VTLVAHARGSCSFHRATETLHIDRVADVVHPRAFLGFGETVEPPHQSVLFFRLALLFSSRQFEAEPQRFGAVLYVIQRDRAEENRFDMLVLEIRLFLAVSSYFGFEEHVVEEKNVEAFALLFVMSPIAPSRTKSRPGSSSTIGRFETRAFWISLILRRFSSSRFF